MAQQTMDHGMQRNFRYLFERMSEPLGMGMKGPNEMMVYYNMTGTGASPRSVHNNMMERPMEMITVQKPDKMPIKELKMISSLCPKSGLFGYFVPEHRQALVELKKILMTQKTPKEMFNMACACRDSPMVHPQLFINALSSSLASRKDTKGFEMPAFFEMMPDLFFTDQAIKQAEKIARMPDKAKSVLMINKNTTGNQKDPESRLWYFREDMGVNSHHFHWHVVFPGEYNKIMEMKRDRRGELFYYMHHAMIARYEAERMCNGLARTKMFNFDEPILEEGYFGKLYSTNAGQHWGTRQANTKLTDLSRFDAHRKINWILRLEDLKKWRDRIIEAIDTGYIRRVSNGVETREKLEESNGIDILGDIIENSEDTPNAQYYGAFGFHNMGHNLISFSHDPNGHHKEQFGPMGDTTTAMRDPIFYRWHKYIDYMFIQYKDTMEPYHLTNGKWPLIWDGIEVEEFKIKNTNTRFPINNILSTHWAQRDINLARGLDFWRNDAGNMDPVWARVTFMDYSPFAYFINVHNTKSFDVKATVRIFMAPHVDEHGTPFVMSEQRNLFYEMDKFSQTLKPGKSIITRESVDSSVTVKVENLFHQLENLDRQKLRDDIRTGDIMPACGCGWPQNLLIPRGTPAGTLFDVFVLITDGQKDEIQDRPASKCRDAMSFCGIINERFPDKRPMGYPFDRRPYIDPNSPNKSAVADINAYTSNIPNSRAMKVIIMHEPHILNLKMDGAPAGMGMVDEAGQTLSPPSKQPAQQSQQVNNPPPSKGGRVYGHNQRDPWAPRPPNIEQWNGPVPQHMPGQRRSRQDSDTWEHLDQEVEDYDMN